MIVYSHANIKEVNAEMRWQEIALRATTFGMNIIYHNRNRLSHEREAGAKYVSLRELISTSDVISLNLALNESTRNIIGRPEFADMKTGVVIVNTARSGLMNTEAMLDALDSGKVSKNPLTG
jgi:glyoxylate reductase